VVRRIVAEGHALCNHSMHHDDLGTMTPAAARADIQAADAAIADAAPGATVTYYRAPYGDFGKSAREAALLGHTPLGWTVDPDDWKLPGAPVIVQRIRDGLTPRAVVLVHDGGGDRTQTIAALSGLIPALLADGWTFDLPEVTQTARPLPSAPASSAPPESGPASSPPSASTSASPSSAPSEPQPSAS
jgi:peptidoglycan/xylan/chitin deacetylase (PgdA/CDA1 family)